MCKLFLRDCVVSSIIGSLEIKEYKGGFNILVLGKKLFLHGFHCIFVAHYRVGSRLLVMEEVVESKVLLKLFCHLPRH